MKIYIDNFRALSGKLGDKYYLENGYNAIEVDRELFEKTTEQIKKAKGNKNECYFEINL